MPADHAHLAPQSYTLSEKTTSCQWEPRLRRHGGTRTAGTPRMPARGSSPRRTRFSLRPGRVRRGPGEVSSGRREAPSKLLSPGLSALSSTARLLLRSVLQEARAGANRSQGVSPQTSLSLPWLSAPEAVEAPPSTGGPGPWARSSPHLGVGAASCCGRSLGHPLPCAAPSNTTAGDQQPLR